MSDQMYRQRAARQRRLMILAGVLVLAVICGVLVVYNTFYDRCTASFDRSAGSVVSSYLQAVARGDLNRVENCWERNAYFDLKSGCSEICLSRVLGTAYQVKNVQLGQPSTAANGRDQLQAVVTVTCPAGGQEQAGEITLDTLAGALPWKHWRVIQSSAGGTSVQPWCK